MIVRCKWEHPASGPLMPFMCPSTYRGPLLPYSLPSLLHLSSSDSRYHDITRDAEAARGLLLSWCHVMQPEELLSNSPLERAGSMVTNHTSAPCLGKVVIMPCGVAAVLAVKQGALMTACTLRTSSRPTTRICSTWIPMLCAT